MKLFILSLFKKLGLIVKLNTPKNNETLLLNYLIKQKKIQTVLDVGANKGQFASTILKHHPRLNVISFEPLSEAYEQLVSKSKPYENWHTFNYAIGSKSSEEEINVSENSHSSSLLEINKSHLDAEQSARVVRKETIKVAPLDSLVNNNNENLLLKVDTQGFELEVLQSSKTLLSNVKLVIIELSFVSLYKGSATFSVIVDFLEKNGFTLYQLFPEFTDPNTHQLLQANGIFIKNEQ